MRAGFGRRFALEVVFIVLVATAAALLHASTIAIVLVMAAAWLAVALLEWLLSRRVGAAVPSPIEVAHRPETPEPVEVAPHVRVIAPEPEPEPEPGAVAQ